MKQYRRGDARYFLAWYLDSDDDTLYFSCIDAYSIVS
jgi:hypothetical protein